MDHLGPLGVKRIVVHDGSMRREDPQYKLRLPAMLKEQIEAAAARNSRSMNAEIVERLRHSFDVMAELNEMADRASSLVIAQSFLGVTERLRNLKLPVVQVDVSEKLAQSLLLNSDDSIRIIMEKIIRLADTWQDDLEIRNKLKQQESESE